jgi:thiol-disulfide isomerase/thioredoxin
VRPSVIPMEFKIAPGGYLWAKYPTSEQFISLKESITWMPERREFSKSKPEEINPVPAGFEPMWPNGAVLKQAGEPKEARFQGKAAVEIPCDGPLGIKVRLYVSPDSLLPMGSIATSGGTEFEMHYKQVWTDPIAPASLRFVPPKDARPYVNRPPDANLIKPGAVLAPFTGKDAAGQAQSLKTLLKGKKGALINFWFTSCVGCIQEMPYLSALEPGLKRQGIGMLGVNSVDGVETIRRTSKLQKMGFPTLVGDPAKGLTKQAGIIAYPVTVVVDADAKVVDAILGFDKARLEKGLEKIGFRP